MFKKPLSNSVFILSILCFFFSTFAASNTKAGSKSKGPKSAAAPQTSVAQNSLIICALDNDYVILPLCVLTQGVFSLIWSKPDSFTDSYKPPIVQTFPQTLQFSLEGQKGTVQIDKLNKIDAHCNANWAYLTSKTPTDKSIHRQSLKVRAFKGLALSAGNASISNEIIVDRTSAEFLVAKSNILNHLNSLEETRVAELYKKKGSKKGFIKNTGIPISKVTRDATIPNIDLFSVTPAGQTTPIYRFCATKRYPFLLKKENIDCSDIVTYTGFIVNSNGSGPLLKDVDCIIDNCEGLKTHTMLGLGAITTLGRTFWVGRRSFPESEFYEIYELKSGTITKIFEISGGSCNQ